MSRRFVIGALALIALLGIGFVIGSRLEPEESREELPTSEPAPAPIRRAQRAVPDERPAPEPVTPETTTAPPPSEDAGATVLVIRVRTKETHHPLPNVAISLRANLSRERADFDAWTENHSAGPFITDETGVIETEAPAHLVLVADVDVTSLGLKSFARHVGRLKAGRSRDVLVEVLRPSDFRFWVKVVTADGSPARAELRVLGVGSPRRFIGRRTRKKRARKTDALPTVRSDASGLLRLDGVPKGVAQIDATGYGSVQVAVGPGHESPDKAMLIALSEAAKLRVQVEGGSPDATWTVLLSTPSYQVARPEGSFLFGHDPSWKADADGRGLATLIDLPAGTPLDLVVTEGDREVHREPEKIILEPGEDRRLEISLGSGVTLRGLVVDQDGQPVTRREIWLTREALGGRAGDRALDAAGGRCHLYTSDAKKAVAKVRTDLEGRFEIPNVSGGSWWLGPAAIDENSERAFAGDAVASVATLIHVAALESTRDVVIRTHRGLFISGRVEEPGGEPATGWFHVSAHNRSVPGHVGTRSRGDGEFVVGPVVPGRYRLKASSRGSFADAEYVEAEAGQTDVVLRFRHGARLVVAAIDGADDGVERGPVRYVVSRLPSDGFHVIQPSKPGPAEFEALVPGRYAVAASTPDGRIAVRANIILTRSKTVTVSNLRLEPGATLRVLYRGPTLWANYEVIAGGAIVATDGIRSGSASVATVPAGALDVRLRVRGADQALRQRVVTKPGEESEILFDLP